MITKPVNREIPKGGVISPKLWLMVADSILKTLEATVIGCPKDLTILVKVKFPDVLIK